MRINKLKGGFRPNQLIRKGYSKPINPKNYGKVIVTVTPKEPNMKKKKLHIQNYDKELTTMIFWGWDILSADESEEVYTFQLVHREDKKLRVYITLGRELQVAPVPYYPEMMYQVYINDDKGQWDYRGWFRGHDLNYKNFWGVVEEIVDKYHPLIPF